MQFTSNEKGVQVLSDSGRTYQIHIKGGVAVFCDCPAGKFARHGNRECKHIKTYNVYAGVVPVAAGPSNAAIEQKVKKTVWKGKSNIVAMPSVAVQKSKLAEKYDGRYKPASVLPLREPQLAEKYDGAKLGHAHWIEPKIDGIRGLAFITKHGVTFVSRSMKPLYNTKAVEADLMTLGLDGVVLDGEMRVAGGLFGDVQGVVKSSVALKDADSVIFVVFDILAIGEWERGRCDYDQQKRRDVLVRLLRPMSLTTDDAGLHRTVGKTGQELDHVRLMPTYSVSTPKEIEALATTFLQEGFEGGMLKDPRAPYRCDRWSAWRKVKFWDDYDVTINGVQEGKGKYAGSLGAIHFEYKGVKSEAGTGFDDAERDSMWAMHKAGKLIGMTAEVACPEFTPDGAMRFPVFRRLREDK